MRSARPKPLHLLCGRADGPATCSTPSTTCEIDRAVVVVGHGAERVTKKLQDAAPDAPARLRRAAVQRGTGDAVGVGLTGLRPDELDDADAATCSCCPGDTPLLRAATIAALVERAPRAPTPPAPCSPPAWPTPPATAGWCGATTTGSAASSSRPTPPTRSSRSTRSTPRSTASAAACSAPALRRISPTTPRASTTSPTWSRCSPRPATAVAAVVADDAAETQGVNDRAPAGRRRGRAAAPHQRGAGCARASPWSTRSAPTSTPPSTSPPTSPCSPARSSRGATVVGAGAELGPNTRLVDCVVGAGSRRREHRRPRRRDRRRGRPSGPFAVLEPGSASLPAPGTGPFYTADSDAESSPRSRDGRMLRGRMELVTKKRLHLVSGRANLAARRGDRRAPGQSSLGDAQPGRVRQRRDALPVRRVRPGHRRVHHPDPRRHRRACR